MGGPKTSKEAPIVQEVPLAPRRASRPSRALAAPASIGSRASQAGVRSVLAQRPQRLVFAVRGVAPGRSATGTSRRGERRQSREPERSRRGPQGPAQGPVAARAQGGRRRPAPARGPGRGAARGSRRGRARRASASGLGGFGVRHLARRLLAPLRGRLALQPRAFPASPRLDPSSDAIVQRLTGWGAPAELRAGVAGTAADWQHPIYYPDANDPVFQIHCTESWGTCEVEGMHVRIPDAARAAAGRRPPDGGGPASGWEYDFWQVRDKPRGGGRLVISWGGRTRIDGTASGRTPTRPTSARWPASSGPGDAARPHRPRALHARALRLRPEGLPGAGPRASRADDRRGAPSQGTRFQLDLIARRDRRAEDARLEEDDPPRHGRVRALRR